MTHFAHSPRRAIARLLILLCLALLLAACGALPDESAEPGGGFPSEPEPTEAPGAVASGTATALPAPDPAEVARSALTQLTQGRIVYNPPEEMQFGQPERVEVRISLDPEANLESGLQGSGLPVEEQIPVSTFMSVRLTGPAFEITSLSSEEQIIAQDTYTQWSWDVVPVRSGEQRLTLTVTARVKLPDFGEEARDLPIIEREITVKVTPVQAAVNFFNQNLPWIGPALLAAVGGALGWAWRQRRRRGD